MDTYWQFLHKWVLADTQHEFRVFQHFDGGDLCIELVRKADRPADWVYTRHVYPPEQQREPQYMLRAVRDQAATLHHFVRRRA